MENGNGLRGSMIEGFAKMILGLCHSKQRSGALESKYIGSDFSSRCGEEVSRMTVVWTNDARRAEDAKMNKSVNDPIRYIESADA